MPDDDDWPFDQARNSAVITMRSIVFEGGPILYVSHDADDHGWQFLDGEPFDMADAVLVALESVVRRDVTLMALADLPPGWIATRASAGGPWQRARREDV